MSNLEIANLFTVEGLVAVITGGGSGLGAGMARALDANGASKVFIIGRREDKLREVADAAVKKNIIPVVGDVSSKESLQRAYDRIAGATDHVDLLIANSGIIGPKGAPPPKASGEKPTLTELRDFLWSVPMEEFTHASHVNVTGALYTAVAFLPLLDAANRKRTSNTAPRPQIVVTSSIAGFNRVPVSGYAYATSKAATTHLVKTLATSLVDYDIRVNGIAPGLYHSEMSAPKYAKEGLADQGVTDGSFSKADIPLTRGGGEEDIASLILWMGAKSGSYLNGNIVVTDGGRLSIFPSTY